jgi:hypothetical protein
MSVVGELGGLLPPQPAEADSAGAANAWLLPGSTAATPQDASTAGMAVDGSTGRPTAQQGFRRRPGQQGSSWDAVAVSAATATAGSGSGPAGSGWIAHTTSTAAAAAASVNPWDLRFPDLQLEARFGQHYGQSMWPYDLAGCLLHACFYCILLFTAGPLGHLFWKLPWHTSIRGFTYMLWVPVMATPRLRPW